MPLGFGSIGTFTTSGDIGGGRQYTRFKGPLLIGSPSGDQASVGTNAGPQPPHLVNVSTARGDMLISVISSFGGAGATSSSFNVSTGLPTGLLYISQTTGAGNLIAAGSTANAPVGLPGGANGVALCWDSAANTLALYDPLSSAWKWPHSTSSGAGATITWTASSS